MRTKSNITPLYIERNLITSIMPPAEPTYAVFVDPDDEEIVVQKVLVWAVIEQFSSTDALPVSTIVRGLTQLPETPYLSDCSMWDDEFVGYFGENDISNIPKISMYDMIEEFKRRKFNERKREQSRESGDSEESTTGEGGDPEIFGIKSDNDSPLNFWEARGIKPKNKPWDETGWSPND